MFLRALLALLLLLPAHAPAAEVDVTVEPLAIGDTFTIESAVLGETRRINVYRAPGYGAAPDAPLPVLYMPDGGIAEDFLHVAGLVQVSVMSGTMRPFMLVGIENTERRRDLTGPTDDPQDREIAPRVGGSAEFRAFLRGELMPAIEARYRTTDETAIVGESLAGLFVLETLVLEPALFDSYIAIDPSLWWNRHALLAQLDALLETGPELANAVFIASSDEPGLAGPAARFAEALQQASPPALRMHYLPMPEERHATIYHPAALRAFRLLFAPAPAPADDAR
ncbi:alpha/beta hydrolase [Novilysobacter erysipheiresistens]|uniref:Alpha/beta hydrolase-fold protein n=1 Tax=Novilysobacter erysipheiresistens TaxID=1749332 RepID=A0ABU7YZZ3_9GAMM